jgi:hypothetical protein
VLFVGEPLAQATPDRFRWPQLIAVTDLASARAAIDEIIEQGEGARGDWRPAHYGRFFGIAGDGVPGAVSAAAAAAARIAEQLAEHVPHDLRPA